MFYLAGVPTYIVVVAKIAGNQAAGRGLPAASPPQYPDALRAAASRGGGATRRPRSATAATPTPRAAGSPRPRARSRWPRARRRTPRAAASGQWVTNEKTLLDRAGLRGVDEILAGLAPDAGPLTRAVDGAL